MSNIVPLSQLAIGQAAHVVSLANELPSFQTLCRNFGIKPGSPVQILRKAPGKGPLQVKILGTLYSMRENDAKGIQVSYA